MAEAGFVSHADQISKQYEKVIKPRRQAPRVYVLNQPDMIKAAKEYQYILIQAPFTKKRLVSLSSAEKFWKDDAPGTQDPFVFLPTGSICGRYSDILRYFSPPQQGGIVQISQDTLTRFVSVMFRKDSLADPAAKAEIDRQIAEAKERRSKERDEAKVKRAQAPLSLVTARWMIDPQAVTPDVVLPPRYNAASSDETVAHYFVELIRMKDEKTNVPTFMKPSEELKERKKKSGRGQNKSLEQLILELKPGHARNITKLNADGSGSSSEAFNTNVSTRAAHTYHMTLNTPNGPKILFVRGTPQIAIQAFNNAMNLLPEQYKAVIKAGLEHVAVGNFEAALNSVEKARNFAAGGFQPTI